jgi:hypothetical protein
VLDNVVGAQLSCGYNARIGKMTGQTARRNRTTHATKRMEDLESALHAAGINEARFVEVAVTAISALRSARVKEPATQFSADERAALTAGGLDLTPRRSSDPDPIADTSALLADSANVAEVAEYLAVTRARIRQRAIERTLFAIRENEEWRFPRAQFVGGTVLRGLPAVVSSLPADLHPVAAWRFLTEPNPDFELVETPQSPMSWLQSGGSPEPVAAVAREL